MHIPHISGIVFRILFSLILLSVLVFRHIKDPSARGRFDAIFLGLLIVGLLFPFIPFERVKSFTAGGVAVSLDDPSVQGAVSSIDHDPRIAEDLRRRLGIYQADVALVPGARILWIDPNPLTTVGAQRVLRALGARTVMTSSSSDALQQLQTDLDFDLIISDVGRHGDSWRTLDRSPADSAVEGLSFIRLLRRDSCAVADIPVIFFSAVNRHRLQDAAEDLLASERIEASDSVQDLIVKVVRTLGRVRREPFVYSARKTPIAESDSCAVLRSIAQRAARPNNRLQGMRGRP